MAHRTGHYKSLESIIRQTLNGPKKREELSTTYRPGEKPEEEDAKQQFLRKQEIHRKVIEDDIEVEGDLVDEGKWDYPERMTKTRETSDMGTTNAASNRKERKAWRKKIKAKKHKELMSGTVKEGATASKMSKELVTCPSCQNKKGKENCKRCEGKGLLQGKRATTIGKQNTGWDSRNAWIKNEETLDEISRDTKLSYMSKVMGTAEKEKTNRAYGKSSSYGTKRLKGYNRAKKSLGTKTPIADIMDYRRRQAEKNEEAVVEGAAGSKPKLVTCPSCENKGLKKGDCTRCEGKGLLASKAVPSLEKQNTGVHSRLAWIKNEALVSPGSIGKRRLPGNKSDAERAAEEDAHRKNMAQMEKDFPGMTKKLDALRKRTRERVQKFQADHPVKEENLDEISKDKLNDYLDANQKDKRDDYRKKSNRSVGWQRANERLRGNFIYRKNKKNEPLGRKKYTAEENLDEISNKKAWIYAMDAARERRDLEHKAGLDKYGMAPKSKLSKEDQKKYNRRSKGLTYVAHKLSGVKMEPGQKAFKENVGLAVNARPKKSMTKNDKASDEKPPKGPTKVDTNPQLNTEPDNKSVKNKDKNIKESERGAEGLLNRRYKKAKSEMIVKHGGPWAFKKNMSGRGEEKSHDRKKMNFYNSQLSQYAKDRVKEINKKKKTFRPLKTESSEMKLKKYIDSARDSAVDNYKSDDNKYQKRVKGIQTALKKIREESTIVEIVTNPDDLKRREQNRKKWSQNKTRWDTWKAGQKEKNIAAKNLSDPRYAPKIEKSPKVYTRKEKHKGRVEEARKSVYVDTASDPKFNQSIQKTAAHAAVNADVVHTFKHADGTKTKIDQEKGRKIRDHINNAPARHKADIVQKFSQSAHHIKAALGE